MNELDHANMRNPAPQHPVETMLRKAAASRAAPMPTHLPISELAHELMRHPLPPEV